MPTQIQHITEILDSRFRFFMSVKIFLNKVTEKQISQEELDDFLKDVLGLRLANLKLKEQAIIPDMIEQADKRLANYVEYKKLITQNTPASLSELAFLLNYEIALSKAKKSAKNSVTSEAESRGQTAFNELEALREIANELTDILPEGFDELATIIQIDARLSQVRENKRVCNTFEIKFIYAWEEKIMQWFKRDKRIKHLEEYAETYKTRETSEHSEAKQKYHPSFEALTAIIIYNKLPKFYKSLEEQRVAEKIGLRRNIDTYYQMLPVLKIMIEGLEAATSWHQNNVLQKQTKNFYRIERDKIITIQSQLQRLLTETQKNAKDVQPAQTAQELLADLAQIQLELNRFVVEWPVECPEEQLQMASIRLKVSQAKETKTLLQKQLYELQNTIDDCNELIAEQQQAQEQQKMAEAAARAASAEAERVAFFARKGAELEAYKKSLIKSQQEKTTTTSSASTSTSSTIVEEKPAEKIAIRLPKLTNKNFATLTKIIDGILDVRYRELRTMFNQLGGDVVQIGNGSSHERFVLNNCYMEMYSKAQFEQEDFTIVAKPHKAGHNSGQLSRFNIESLQKLLNRCGITKETLAQFEMPAERAGFLSTAGV